MAVAVALGDLAVLVLDDVLDLARLRLVASLGDLVSLGAPMTTLVASAKVKPGRRTAATPPGPPSRPRQLEPAAGTVVVAPPDPPDVYTPSAAEVALARAYVRCGRRLGFPAALAWLQAGPREAVVAAHRAELEPPASNSSAPRPRCGRRLTRRIPLRCRGPG